MPPLNARNQLCREAARRPVFRLCGLVDLQTARPLRSWRCCLMIAVEVGLMINDLNLILINIEMVLARGRCARAP
jgi:hypothetical protein